MVTHIARSKRKDDLLTIDVRWLDVLARHRNPQDVRSGLYVWCRLYIYKPSGGLQSEHSMTVGAHLCHGQIPVLLHNVLKLNERHGNHPIIDWRRIWVERKYLQLYRVEVVYSDRRLGVGVQIFVELLQYSMYFKGCFWRRQK
jgi:hypothetical protein